MPKYRWDKGLDFEKVYRLLAKDLGRRKGVGKCYTAILLLQLRNGLRIGEAVAAFQQFLADPKPKIEVRVEKKRRPETRTVIVPQELLEVRQDCRDLAREDPKRLVARIKPWVIETYGFNTHSLRYAFITYLIKNNVPLAVVAKITHHSRLDYLVTYTQEKIAEDVLEHLL
jgi:integrase